jgi:hypothetical protein
LIERAPAMLASSGSDDSAVKSSSQPSACE